MKYSKEFKEEALKLSDEIGVKKAAQQLGIQYYTLSDWRSKRSAAIKHQKDQMSGAKAICKFLKISESGYYRWLKNQGKPGARKILLVKIQGILAEHPDNRNYGVRRMHTALAQRGMYVSIRTVYRTMSESGLIHRCRRPHGITKADTATQDRDNLIKRDFTASAPLKKLLTDITEVQCADGKLYVSPVRDCYRSTDGSKKRSFTATAAASIPAMLFAERSCHPG